MSLVSRRGLWPVPSHGQTRVGELRTHYKTRTSQPTLELWTSLPSSNLPPCGSYSLQDPSLLSLHITGGGSSYTFPQRGLLILNSHQEVMPPTSTTEALSDTHYWPTLVFLFSRPGDTRTRHTWWHPYPRLTFCGRYTVCNMTHWKDTKIYKRVPIPGNKKKKKNYQS